MSGLVIVASGGHGSTFILNKLKAHKRPDVTFGDKLTAVDLKLSDKPTKEYLKEFKKRTNGFYTLNLDKSIEDNMVSYLNAAYDKNLSVLLSGRISRVGKFFTNNDVKNVVCLVRHPLHAMVSLLVHRHPEKLEWFGGNINSEECVLYYSKLWNDTVSDHILANNKIIRYEFARKDSLNTSNKVRSIFNEWKQKRRNLGVLKEEFEEMLESKVKENYYKLYSKWDI